MRLRAAIDKDLLFAKYCLFGREWKGRLYAGHHVGKKKTYKEKRIRESTC